MGWSLRLATVAGIGIFVHWTFLLVILYFGYVFWMQPGATAVDVVLGLVLILSVFFCVILHELGHSLTAKRFGIGTKQITLLPIGGVASLERMPEDPRQELWITVMGPMVNVVIALVLMGVLLATGWSTELWQVAGLQDAFARGRGFVFQLMVINVFLVVFNLIPAFPMDGGRILRAILAFSMDYPKATRIAARTGQGFAILFAILAIMAGFHPFLLLIALFVFLGAEAETRHAEMRAAFRGILVRDAMMTRFRVLGAGDPLKRAVAELLAGSQQDFPVVEDIADGAPGRVVGMLPRDALIRALAEGGPERSVGDAMMRECPVATETEPIDRAFQRMRERGCAAAPVLRGPALVGLLTLENVSEMIMVRSAIEQGGPGRTVVGP